MAPCGPELNWSKVHNFLWILSTSGKIMVSYDFQHKNRRIYGIWAFWLFSRTHFMHLKIKQEPAWEKLLGKSLGKRYDPRYLLFGICPRMSHMSKHWYMYKVMYSNFSHCPAPVHSVLYTRFKFSSHQHYLDILVKTSCQEPHKAIFFFLFFFLEIHSMQGWKATTRHGITRKRSTWRLKNIGNL